ncbi:serine/threonine-protein kinase WNK2-like isoform X5 [Protopterus annectens]|uniref:serine/threonine-protein kinase WNK2-like isoform X5 n=1 Tax=Protopterus annectens TaxID=7888 RepID=UPI001CF9F52A|nr:serine/threonine-protein kinase WNK2-like isoform X5 [Protopterus annectens]
MPGSNPPRKFKIKTAMSCEKIGKGLTIAETMSQFLEHYNQYTNQFSQLINQPSSFFGCQIPGQPGADLPPVSANQMRQIVEIQKAAAVRNAATARYAASVLNATVQISGVNPFPVDQNAFPPVPPDFIVEQNSFNSQWTSQFSNPYSCNFPPYPPTEPPPTMPPPALPPPALPPPALQFGPPLLPPATVSSMPPMLPPPSVLNVAAAMHHVAEAQKAAAAQVVQNIMENKHFNSEQNLWLNPFTGFSSDYSSFQTTEGIPEVSVSSTMFATSTVPSTPAVISAPPMLNAAAVQFISETRKSSGVQKPIESKYTSVRSFKKRQTSTEKRNISSVPLTTEDHTQLKQNSCTVSKAEHIYSTSPAEYSASSVNTAASAENQVSFEESVVNTEEYEAQCMEISDEETLEENAETTAVPEYIDPDPPIDIIAMNTDFMGRSEEIYDVLMNCHWQPLDTAMSGIPAVVELR